MPGAKKGKSAKAVNGPRSGSAADPNKKQGSELWGSCATAWFRYIRPPSPENPQKKGISFLLTLHWCRHQEREDQERANP
jgi:hypothetical protein